MVVDAVTDPRRHDERAGAPDGPGGIVAADHVGFSVSSLDEAIAFWTGALGFTVVRRGEMGGPFLERTTGVAGAVVRMALVQGPDGRPVELLEYATVDEPGRVPPSAAAIGAAHVAFTTRDIGKAIERIEAAGWTARGTPQPIPGGPRQGTLVAYVSGPDGITIELMQPPAR